MKLLRRNYQIEDTVVAARSPLAAARIWVDRKILDYPATFSDGEEYPVHVGCPDGSARKYTFTIHVDIRAVLTEAETL